MLSKLQLKNLKEKDIIELDLKFVKYLKLKLESINKKHLFENLKVSKTPLLRIFSLKRAYTVSTINKIISFFHLSREVVEENITRYKPFGSRRWYLTSLPVKFPLLTIGKVIKRKTSSLLISLQSFYVKHIIKPSDLVLIQVRNVCLPTKISENFEFTIKKDSKAFKLLYKKLGRIIKIRLIGKLKPTSGNLRINNGKLDLSNGDFPESTIRYSSRWYYIKYKNIIYLAFLDSQQRLHYVVMPRIVCISDFFKTGVYFSEGVIKWAFPEWFTSSKMQNAYLDIANTNPSLLINWISYMKKIFLNLSSLKIYRGKLDYYSPKFSKSIKKKLMHFWEKYGFKVKNIRYVYTNGRYFSPIGCFRITISHTGIAEAYMSLFKTLLHYVTERNSSEKSLENALVTFLVEDSNGDMGCSINFSRKLPDISITRYSNYFNQIKLIKKIYSKIHIKAKIRKIPYPHLLIRDFDTILKLVKYGIFNRKKERRLKLLYALLLRSQVNKKFRKNSPKLFKKIKREIRRLTNELKDFYDNLKLPLPSTIRDFLQNRSKFVAGKL